MRPITTNPPDALPHCRVLILGDVMTDTVARLAAPIAVGSDTLAAISTHGGGSGANQATWLATCAPNLSVSFVGAVGNDLFGDAQREAFERVGVTAHLVRDPLRPTGTVVSVVDGSGERSMLTERGANAGLSLDALPRDLFQPGTWLHISGYTLLADDTRPVALEAIRLARATRMGFSVDPASEALLLVAGVENFLTWTSGADLCFPNRDEGQLLSGQRDPDSIATALCAHYGAVALKLGASGAILAEHGTITAMRECVPGRGALGWNGACRASRGAGRRSATARRRAVRLAWLYSRGARTMPAPAGQIHRVPSLLDAIPPLVTQSCARQ
jgi:sugar/nucleoside kinase (ribokinase family)